MLMDKVYEQVAPEMELSSGSSDEEEQTPTKVLVGRKMVISTPRPSSSTLIATQRLIFHSVSGNQKESTRSAFTTKRTVDDEDIYGDDHPTSGGKRKRVVKTAEAAAATPKKVAAVPMDEQGNAILPITIGLVTLHSAGKIIHDRPAYHNKRYIYPVGFHSSRPYNSAISPEIQTIYHSRILEGEAGPIFDVFAEDQPAEHYSASTPTGAWTAVVKVVNSRRGKDYTNSASGPDFFGLSNSTISMIIDRLSGAELCLQYQRKVYETSHFSKIAIPNTAGSTGKVGNEKERNVEDESIVDDEGNEDFPSASDNDNQREDDLNASFIIDDRDKDFTIDSSNLEDSTTI